MNELQNDFQPPMELPKPQAEGSMTPLEAGSGEQVSERRQAQSLEQGAAQHASIPPQPPLLPSFRGIAPLSQGTSAMGTGSAADTSVLIADDVDLIEKEWVDKAKEIVEKTKNDPHAMNKKMNEVKADYLKKRYNKELKLTED